VQSLNEVPAERGLCYFFFGSAFPTVFSQLYLWLLVFAFHAAGIVRRRVAFAGFVCAIWCRSSRSSKMLWPKMAEAKKPSKSLYVNQKRHQHRAANQVGRVGQDSLESHTTSWANCIRRACKHDLALGPPFPLTTRLRSSSSAPSQLKCSPFMRDRSREHSE